jgi:uncharacterized small protein (DUF1192 family)
MALSALNSATAQAVLSSNTTRTSTTSEEQATNQVAGTDTVEISAEGYALSAQASSETGSGETSEESEQSGTAGAAAVGTGSPASSSADSSEDTIEELEQQIGELQKEIAELAAKARADEAARVEMNGKQAELASLYNELVQLQQSQEQG